MLDLVDIKIKSKSTIKKLDNAVVKTQKIKGNIVEIKDKSKENQYRIQKKILKI